MPYFVIRNTEDGLTVEEFTDREALNDWITDETSVDLRPECRVEFQAEIPDERTSDKFACIIEGDIIMPRKSYHV